LEVERVRMQDLGKGFVTQGLNDESPLVGFRDETPESSPGDFVPHKLLYYNDVLRKNAKE